MLVQIDPLTLGQERRSRVMTTRMLLLTIIAFFVLGVSTYADDMKADVESEGFGLTSKAVNKSITCLPEVVVYEHKHYGGKVWRTNLGYLYVGGWWNDKISSIVVVSGVWKFFEHRDFKGKEWTLGPGYYRWVEDVKIPNDTISSFKPIAITGK
jgi:hypothetical protein